MSSSLSPSLLPESPARLILDHPSATAPKNTTRFFTKERITQIENTLQKVAIIAGMVVFIVFAALSLTVSLAALYHGDWYISMAGAVIAFTCIASCFDLKEILDELNAKILRQS